MIRSVLTGRTESIAILSFVLLFTTFAIVLRTSWISSIPTMLRDSAWLGIVAIGQTLLMISGEFDLSVGSVFAFTGLVFASLMQIGLGVIPSLLCSLLIASAIGSVNGLITLRFRVPSLIVTLGSLFIYRGLIYLITQGFPITIPGSMRDSSLILLLGGSYFGFNNSILFLGLITVTFMVILSSTRYGNHVFAVGGDAKSALSRGVSPVKTKMIAFVLCSLLTGLAGIIATCYLSSVGTNTAEGLEFETIAAAVIGGCSLRGGVGSIWSTVLGVGTLITLRAGLVMMGINIFWYPILLGALLISFLAFKGLLSGAV